MPFSALALRLVTLAGSDDLKVRGFQVEPELARVVLADFGTWPPSDLLWTKQGLTGITVTLVSAPSAPDG
jgi:hypothetical protein